MKRKAMAARGKGDIVVCVNRVLLAHLSDLWNIADRHIRAGRPDRLPPRDDAETQADLFYDMLEADVAAAWSLFFRKHVMKRQATVSIQVRREYALMLGRSSFRLAIALRGQRSDEFLTRAVLSGLYLLAAARRGPGKRSVGYLASVELAARKLGDDDAENGRIKRAKRRIALFESSKFAALARQVAGLDDDKI